MNLQQIREKYPQYADLSDKQLVDGLHRRFYADMPVQDFYKRVGFNAAPETTVAGHAKELVKGLVPGAVGLVEQAAIGASALLPTEYEKPTREAIAGVAGAAKKPFEAAPGYEDAVSRKLGEAVGSTVPFLLAGPLGLAGRAAAVGLGVSAGAGEARTRAEKDGATDEQRAAATALGTIPGALEAFAPLRILQRVPDAATATGVQLVKRAMIAGGEEAAQEAASGFAQNLIAKGVYKPEQELIEGLGEQAAYGAGAGAIVQGLMDLALGRRARTRAQPTQEAPIDRAAQEAAAQTSAEPAEAAPQVQGQPAAEIPPLPDSYEELVRYSAQLKALPKSAQRDAALKAAREKREAIVAKEVTEKRISEEKAKEFLTAEEAAAAEVTKRDELGMEPEVRTEKTTGGIPQVLDSATIKTIGFSRGKVHDALVGKSIDDPEIRTILEEYKNRPTASANTAAKIDAFLAKLPEPVTKQDVEDAGTTEQDPGGTSTPVAGEPGERTAAAGSEVAEPDRVVLPAEDAGDPAVREGEQPAAVAPAAVEPVVEQQPKRSEPTSRDFNEYTETDIESALELGLITPEQAETLRADLNAEPEPPTAMAAAFAKRVEELQAEMDALKRNGRAPAPKSPARKKYDELQAQLKTLVPETDGSVTDRIERLGVTGVFGGRDAPPVVDFPSLKEGLVKARIVPRTANAVLAYVGFDAEGNFTPPVSREEAAKMAGLKDGANITRIANKMGVTEEVRSRFHASQVGLTGIAKNVSEADTGLTDTQPRPGVLYEPAAGKKPAKVAPFLKPAVGADGALDFGKLSDREVAEIYARASNFDPARPENTDVIKRLNDEIAARTKADRKSMQQAMDSAYRVVREQEEAAQDAEFDDDYVDPDGDLTEGRRASRGLIEEQGVDEDYQQTRMGPADLENSREMDAALRGKSFADAVNYAIKNARDPADRYVLVKVKRRFEELSEKGVEFKFSLTRENNVVSSGALGVTLTRSAGLGDATSVDVLLNGFTGNPATTLEQETLVHELVHAVTSAQISYAPQGSAAVKLRNLQQELVRFYNQKSRRGELTTVEKGVIANALQNEHELIAYGLTSGKTQEWLASVPVSQGESFLSRLFKVVSNVLGLKASSDSALAKLMTISEEILDESLTPYVAEANRRGLSFGRQANTTGVPSWALREAQGLKVAWHKGPVALIEAKSIFGKQIFLAAKEGKGRTSVDIRSYTGDAFTPAELEEMKRTADQLSTQENRRVTPQSEAAAAQGSAIGDRKQDSFSKKVGRQLKGNTALRLREKFTDSMAPMEQFFVDAYAGATRTASGRLNPMVLLSRALDSGRVSKAAQLEGGLARKDGLIVAAPLQNAEGEPVSYAGVLRDIAGAAKSSGKTYEQYRRVIDEILYGHREFNLRERNRELEQQAKAFDAAKKPQEAAKLRESIVDLLLTDEQIDAREAAYQGDAFIKKVSSDLDTVRFNLLDMLVSTGRLSPEMAADYKDAIGYIPFQRLGDYENRWNNATRGANRGAAALKSMRKLEGSSRESASVIENFSGLMDWATGEAMKNEAARRALEDMTLMGAAQKRQDLPSNDSPGGMVSVYENGVPTKYYVPDPAHLATFSIADPQLSNVFKALSHGTRLLRAGVTSMPPFAVKQVFDDIVRAYTYAGVKNNRELVRNILFQFPKNWFNELRGKHGANIKELERLGIVGTFDFTQHSNLKDIMEEAGAKERGLGSTILRVMEAGAKASDVSVREAIYKQVMKETGDTAQAESAAREIINFSRRGSSGFMNIMISVVPFFNAYARGMDKLATAAAGGVVGKTTSTARSMFYKRMGVMTAMGLAYALLMQDDEEYQALPDHVRDTNWVLPYGKELGFTPVIPVPPELAFFFKAIPERLVRYYKMQGTEEEQAGLSLLGNLLSRGVDVFSSPNMTPQLLRPLIENLVNYSFFMGRPLESQAQLELRPFARHGVGTSDAMKAVANGLEDVAQATGVEALAISPIKLENLVRGLFGTAAGLSLSIADMMVNPGRTDRPLHQQLAPQLSGAAALMKTPVGSRYIDEIYNLERRTTQAHKTLNRLAENRPQEVEQFQRENAGMLAIRGSVNGIMEQIRALNEAALALDRNQQISADERRARIDELRAMQNDIARQVFMLRKIARDAQASVE